MAWMKPWAKKSTILDDRRRRRYHHRHRRRRDVEIKPPQPPVGDGARLGLSSAIYNPEVSLHFFGVKNL